MSSIERVKHLMKAACPAPVVLQQLCEEAGVRYATFRKQFRRTEGITLSEYYQQLRLQTAERLLRDSDKLIFEIADEFGFHDEENFSRWFFNTKGVRPTVYRERQTNRGRG
jgi:two-component system response regulator YesN